MYNLGVFCFQFAPKGTIILLKCFYLEIRGHLKWLVDLTKRIWWKCQECPCWRGTKQYQTYIHYLCSEEMNNEHYLLSYFNKLKDGLVFTCNVFDICNWCDHTDQTDHTHVQAQLCQIFIEVKNSDSIDPCSKSSWKLDRRSWDTSESSSFVLFNCIYM